MNNVYLSSTRLYVCGVLMPVVSVEISSGVDQYPVATFSLPPDQRLLELGRMDKIPVHIFQKETDVESPEYVLVFYGFISGRVYRNTAVSRDITFQAMSYYSLLSEIRVEFLSTLDDYTRVIIAGQSETAMFQNITLGMDYLQHLMLYSISPTADSQPKLIDFPYQYIQNILDWLITPWEQRNLPTDNQLYRNASSIARIYGRYFGNYTAGRRSLCKLPYFDEFRESDGIYVWDVNGGSHVFPVLKGAQGRAEASIITGVQRSSGHEQQMLRGLIDILSESFEYEFAVYASPAYRPEDRESSDDFSKETHINDICFKPMLADSIPPLCNVVFRSQILGISQQEEYNTQATRVRIHDVSTQAAVLMRSIGATGALPESVLTTFYPMHDKQESMRDPDEVMKDALETVHDEDVTAEEISNAYAKITLAQEYYTGVHVQQTGKPRWWDWIPVSAEIDTALVREELTKRLAQRMLIQAVFGKRTMQVTMTYNPYITPGFPAVIFDATNTGLAFAGYVLAVSHRISQTSMETSVTLSHVRTLDYAAVFDIRHPIDTVEKVLHNEGCMTEIYNAVIGVPVDKKHRQISGSRAMSYENIKKEYMNDSTSTSSPQNSPSEAYTLQRRNIVTFDDFLSFMGLSVGETGFGQDGAATPFTLVSSKDKKDKSERIFEDRLNVYVPYIKVAEEDKPTGVADASKEEMPSSWMETAEAAIYQLRKESLAAKISHILVSGKTEDNPEVKAVRAELEALEKEETAAREKYQASFLEHRTEARAAEGANANATANNSVGDTDGTEIVPGIKAVSPAALLRAVAKQEFSKVIYS